MSRLNRSEIEYIANNMNVELSGNAIQDVDTIKSEYVLKGPGSGRVPERGRLSYDDAYRILDRMRRNQNENGSDVEFTNEAIGFSFHAIGIALAVVGILLVKFLKYPGKWLFIPITAALTIILSFLSTILFDFNSYSWYMQRGLLQDLAQKLDNVPVLLGVSGILLVSLALTFLVYALTEKFREKWNDRIILKIGGKTGCYILLGSAVFFVVFSFSVFLYSTLPNRHYFYVSNFGWFWKWIFSQREITNTMIEILQGETLLLIGSESLLVIVFSVLLINNKKKIAAIIAIITPILCLISFDFFSPKGLNILQRNIIGSLLWEYHFVPGLDVYLFGGIQALCLVMIGITILCKKKAVYGITRFLLQLVTLSHLITMLLAPTDSIFMKNHLLKLMYSSVGYVHIDPYKFKYTHVEINASVLFFLLFALCAWVIDMILAKECNAKECNAEEMVSAVSNDNAEEDYVEIDLKDEKLARRQKRKGKAISVISATVLVLLAGIIIAVISEKTGEESQLVEEEKTDEKLEEEPVVIFSDATEIDIDDSLLTDSTTITNDMFRTYVINNYGDIGVMPYLFDSGSERIGIISYMQDRDWDTAGVDIVSWDGEAIQKIYSGSELNYYAEYAEGKIHILYDTKPDYSLSPDMQDNSVEYHVISFENSNISMEEIDRESYLNRLVGTICLNNKAHLTTPESVESDKTDYSYDSIKSLLKLASEKGELVLDTMHVKSNGENGLYATLRKVEPDFLPAFMDDKIYSSFDVAFVDQTGASIVSTESLLDEDDPNDGFWNTILSFGCFDLDDNQHYYVEVYGTNEYSTKYLYGYSGGKQKLLLSGQDIYQTENGIFCSAYGESGIINVEVAFDDGEYKQFSSEVVSEEEMRNQFENFDGINNSNLDEFYNMKEIYIEGWDECVVESILDAHLVDIRKGTNGKYYMTYEYTFRCGYSPESITEFMMVQYYTYRVEYNKLVKEEGIEFINHDRKGNDTRLGLPYLYVPVR